MPSVADLHTQVHFGTEELPEPVELDPDRPFRILLVGDFSGRSWRENPPVKLAPLAIDRDNFDDVLEQLDVRLDLDGIPLSFAELEDFHPDRMFERVQQFHNLDRLDIPEDPGPPPQRATASGGGLLDQIVAREEVNRPVTAEDANDLPSFIRRVTAGHVVPRESAAKQRSDARRLELATRLMQSLLRHPRMQDIEAAWRAAFMLVRGLDTDGDLKIYLLDLTLVELVGQLDAVRTELKKKGAWGMIAANYTFGQSDAETQALARLSGLGRSLGAPFISEGRLPGNTPPSPLWEELRRSERAQWIGLALPRFLLRLPYGKDTSPIDSFPFEEMPGSDHNSYLWGNPSFFCANLMGQSFLSHGWELGGRLARRIDGLPQHIYREDGEAVAKPCAEVLMTERNAETLLDLGFMPLASLKNEPAALIVRFQSIATPAKPLAGLR